MGMSSHATDLSVYAKSSSSSSSSSSSTVSGVLVAECRLSLRLRTSIHRERQTSSAAIDWRQKQTKSLMSAQSAGDRCQLCDRSTNRPVGWSAGDKTVQIVEINSDVADIYMTVGLFAGPRPNPLLPLVGTGRSPHDQPSFHVHRPRST